MDRATFPFSTNLTRRLFNAVFSYFLLLYHTCMHVTILIIQTLLCKQVTSMLHSGTVINTSCVDSFTGMQTQVLILYRLLVIRPSGAAGGSVEGGSYAGAKCSLHSSLFSSSGRCKKIKKMPGLSMMFGEWTFMCLWESWHLQYWLCWL